MKEKIREILKVILLFIVYLYIKVIYRLKVIGRDNIPNEGPIIFCGNHRSLIDAPLIYAVSGRKMRFLAKKELTESKLFSFIGYLANAIYVNRDAKDMVAIKTALKTLKSGENIALFPEGTRNGIEKGEKVKDGVAFFALNSDAIILPVGIKGGEKPFKRITITFGNPINFDEYKQNKKEKEVLEEVTEKIMNSILKLSK